MVIVTTYLEGLHSTQRVHSHVQLSQLPCGVHAGNMEAHWESLLGEPEGDIQEVECQCCTHSPPFNILNKTAQNMCKQRYAGKEKTHRA